ncbi:MAG TPA: hypothetical protein VFS43_43090 [Polyangiaceae bacterium]|nr:hypothetical protein [Polyangiaceae bacterium]
MANLSRPRLRWLTLATWGMVAGLTMTSVNCGDDDEPPSPGAGGSAGGAQGGGTGGSGMGGSGTGGSGTGGASTGGSAGAGAGGAPTAGAGGGGGQGASGTQPLGGLCANTGNCTQSTGAAVCCVVPGCSAPCACTLASECEGSTQFLPCSKGDDCNVFGGGKVCCKETLGSQIMQYCTKPSGCQGEVLP